MTTTVPPWLATMREITGTKEVQGSGDSPIILAWRDEIARRYPDMAAYCREYTHDSIAWCGLTVAYCMAHNGIKPVKDFLWADNWRKFGKKLTTPQLGAILTFKRTGGNHVAFYEGEEGAYYLIRGGNQSDSVCLMKKLKSECTGVSWPLEGAVIDDTPPVPSPAVGVTFSALVPGGFFSSTPFDKTTGPASIRMNNPGALNIAAWIRTQPGYVGDKVTSMSGASPNSTVVFSSPEYGVAAWWKLLEKYRAANAVTVRQIIERYGGGQPNYASEYVDKITEWSGLDEDQEIDLNDDKTLLKLAKAMFRYEAGKPSPLRDQQILMGFNIGRGKPGIAPAVSPTQAAAKDTGKQSIGAMIVAALVAFFYWMIDHPVYAAICAVLIVAAAYFVWRWWHHKQAPPVESVVVAADVPVVPVTPLSSVAVPPFGTPVPTTSFLAQAELVPDHEPAKIKRRTVKRRRHK